MRRDVVPPVFHAFPLADSGVAATRARKPGVPRVGQTERRVVKHRARLAGQSPFHAEIRNGAISNHFRETWLPTYPVIDSQPRRRPPVSATYNPKYVSALSDSRIGDCDILDLPNQKVCQA